VNFRAEDPANAQCPEHDPGERTPSLRRYALAFGGVGIALLLAGILLAPSRPVDPARQFMGGAAQWVAEAFSQARSDFGALQARMNAATQ
jgi:hypothetical protein